MSKIRSLFLTRFLQQLVLLCVSFLITEIIKFSTRYSRKGFRERGIRALVDTHSMNAQEQGACTRLKTFTFKGTKQRVFICARAAWYSETKCTVKWSVESTNLIKYYYALNLPGTILMAGNTRSLAQELGI